MGSKTLGFSILIFICVGFTYTWSVFAVPLTELLGRKLTEVTLTYTIGILTFAVITIASGRIQDRFGPVLAVRIGAFLFGGGLILCGFISSLIWLYICYGIVAYSGAGLVYCAVLMNINNFYPEKKGAVSGLLTAGYGFSAVLFSPAAAFLIDTFSILTAYKIIGAFFFLMLTFSSFFIKKAPVPETTAILGNSESSVIDMTWGQMIKSPVFYMIYSLMAAGSTAGLMIIGQASVLAQGMMGADISKAALTVSVIAGANTLGRIVWGGMSDRIGRINTLHFIFSISASMMFGLSCINNRQYALFVILTMLIAFCYGGIMGTFPALVTDHFGAKNNGTNYAVILSGISVGALIGPLSAAWTQTLTPGNYNTAFYISSTLSFIGVVLTFMLRKKSSADRA